jgi:3-hydroxyisobutyrate dehydrogenase-like beta-hydroxyacid dehydrogenase
MKIAFIGMGEAGAAIVSGWGEKQAANISAYDIKSDSPSTASEIRDRCARLGIACCESLGAALRGADIVFCTVTADQAVEAARAAAPTIGQGTIWCDLNSCAPSSKTEAAEAIESGGGRYVDVAVMSPVHPKLNMVPLLVGGPHAADVVPLLEGLPMAPKLMEGPVGKASSIKMLRSVMVKGLEALTAECTLAAVAAGVEAEVFASLDKSHPGSPWDAQAAYNFERSLVHGVRRAAEMEEVAKTLADLDLPNDMARATVAWQRRIGTTGLPAPSDPGQTTARQIAEALLPVLRHKS